MEKTITPTHFFKEQIIDFGDSINQHVSQVLEASNNLKRKFDEVVAVKLNEIGEETDSKKSLSCPITGELLVVPLTIDCGHTFEYYAINEHVKSTLKCPICNENIIHDIKHKKPTLVIEDLVDSKYPNYRNSKKLTSEKYTIQKTRFVEIEFERGKEMNKEKIKQGMDFLDSEYEIMIKKGWGSCTVHDPDKESSKVVKMYQQNRYVRKAMDEFMEKRGIKFIYEESGDGECPFINVGVEFK